MSDGALSVGPLATSISFGASSPALVSSCCRRPRTRCAGGAASAARTSPAVAERDGGRGRAGAGDPGGVLSRSDRSTRGAGQRVSSSNRCGRRRAYQPVATLNHFTPGPHIDPTLELLAAAPANLEYLSTVPVDWHVRPAFPDAEETPRDRIDVLLEQVQMGGMALSVGVVWWASRVSGLLGSSAGLGPGVAAHRSAAGGGARRGRGEEVVRPRGSRCRCQRAGHRRRVRGRACEAVLVAGSDLTDTTAATAYHRA